jgi:hypothetical protein
MPRHLGHGPEDPGVADAAGRDLRLDHAIPPDGQGLFVLGAGEPGGDE